jgi:protein gp37
MCRPDVVTPSGGGCHAEVINRRLGTSIDYRAENTFKIETFLDEMTLTAPLRWRRPSTIFPGSMTDLFGEWVTDKMPAL